MNDESRTRLKCAVNAYVHYMENLGPSALSTADAAHHIVAIVAAAPASADAEIAAILKPATAAAKAAGVTL